MRCLSLGKLLVSFAGHCPLEVWVYVSHCLPPRRLAPPPTTSGQSRRQPALTHPNSIPSVITQIGTNSRNKSLRNGCQVCIWNEEGGWGPPLADRKLVLIGKALFSLGRWCPVISRLLRSEQTTFSDGITQTHSTKLTWHFWVKAIEHYSSTWHSHLPNNNLHLLYMFPGSPTQIMYPGCIPETVWYASQILNFTCVCVVC